MINPNPAPAPSSDPVPASDPAPTAAPADEKESDETVDVEQTKTPEGAPVETVDVEQTETPEGTPVEEKTEAPKVIKTEKLTEIEGGKSIESATVKCLSDETAVIKKIEASGKKLVIPDTITVDGTEYAVTTIAKGAFKGESEVTQITIGENVTAVKAGAFKGITKLKKVTVESYEEGMFAKKAFSGVDTKNCKLYIEVPSDMSKKERKAVLKQAKAELKAAKFAGTVKIVRVEK